MRLLRIVPDDTKFDFMRFRRISFPASAVFSIIAIALFFFHGLNFGIDFVGGTLIEVQSKTGPADLAKMRATLGGLGLGDIQLQEFGAPTDVLIRVAQQPGGEQAQQVAITKVREALGSDVDYCRIEVVGPRVSTELLATRLLRQPDQHVGRTAELLKLHLAEAEPAERGPHLGKIGRPRLRLHLHQRAADEVDAEVQTVKEIKRDRQNRQQRRRRKADAPEAHEIELGVIGYDAK